MDDIALTKLVAPYLLGLSMYWDQEKWEKGNKHTHPHTHKKGLK